MHACLSVRICAVAWVNVSTEEGEGRVDSVGVPLQQAFVCQFMCQWRVCVSVNAETVRACVWVCVCCQVGQDKLSSGLGSEGERLKSRHSPPHHTPFL